MKRVLRLVHRRQATLSYAAPAFLRTVRDLARSMVRRYYYHVEKGGIGTQAPSGSQRNNGHVAEASSCQVLENDARFADPVQTSLFTTWRCVYDLDHSDSAASSLQPVPAIYNAESGARQKPARRNRQARCQPDGCAVVRIKTE